MSFSPKKPDSWLSPSKENIATYTLFEQLSHVPKMLKRELRAHPQEQEATNISLKSYGENQAKGNVVSIQPWMSITDYISAPSLYKKCEKHMKQAQSKDWLHSDTIVVFPEHIGTWLIAQGEMAFIYACEEWRSALQWLAVSHPIGIAKHPPSSLSAKDALSAVFSLKAERMAKQYQLIFSRLAKAFGVTIVAGSMILPSPTRKHDQIAIEDGALENISLVFKPNGTAHPSIIREYHLSSFERQLISPASEAPQQIFDTPAGCIAVALGNDFRANLFPSREKELILLNPIFGEESNQQLEKKGTKKGTKKGKCLIQTHFHGSVWDLSSRNESQISGKTLDVTVPYTDKKSLIFNVWLGC